MSPTLLFPGRNINTETSIFALQTGEANHTTTVNILDCHAHRLFWVSWMNQAVQVGKYLSHKTIVHFINGFIPTSLYKVDLL